MYPLFYTEQKNFWYNEWNKGIIRNEKVCLFFFAERGPGKSQKAAFFDGCLL